MRKQVKFNRAELLEFGYLNILKITRNQDLVNSIFDLGRCYQYALDEFYLGKEAFTKEMEDVYGFTMEDFNNQTSGFSDRPPIVDFVNTLIVAMTIDPIEIKA